MPDATSNATSNQTRTVQRIQSGRHEIEVQVTGSGPVILCVHGWPEHPHSWRHQVAYFAARGYTVAAMSVRGYGNSSRPTDVASYTMAELTGDVAAVAAALSPEPVILFGHDWGAPIVYQTALAYPERVRAVAGLSVPYAPAGDTSSLDLMGQLYAGRFFYQIYFQQPGVVERELEADTATALCKIYFALSGDAPLNEWLKHKPADATLLQDLVDPQPFPAWLPQEDLAVYIAAFELSGFTGAINRYRAQPLDHAASTPYRGKLLQQPACLIGGERDAVRNFVTGFDMYADPGRACEDFRGVTVIPGAGHWIQQEAPDETNAALADFLASLTG